MALHYIIDGYNLIKHRSFAARANTRDPRFALIQFLRQEKPCGSLKNKVTIVFDGYSGDFSLRGLEFEVVFSCEASADEWIKKIVETTQAVKSLIVVSDDRQVRDFSRICGVMTIGIEEFLKSSSKKASVSKDDSSKAQLSYSAAHKINEELKKIWLKK
jgi:predicted RNA-binding protein with PIN domain